MPLFDSHCHLQDRRIFGTSDAVVIRAREAGVSRMLCCGTCEADWPSVKELARRYPEIIAGFGLHPWYIANRSDRWLTVLERFLVESPKSAVAEIGLDHAVDKSNFEDQAAVFVAQLKLARRLHRPLSIHCRKAWGDLVRIIKEQCGLPDGGVIHSYSGPVELIPELEDLNVSFSFSGSITHDRNRRGRAAAAAVPDHRLLVETDAPDIPPVGVGQEENEPANIGMVVRTLAEIRGMTEEEIGELTNANASAIFGP
jgi:TatD DNase family protein